MALGTESIVAQDDRACPLCTVAIEGYGAPVALAFLADGTLRWVHPLCAVRANGGVSAMRPRVASQP